MTEIACCAVDWGSSNFRLWAFDRSGAVVAKQTSAAGAVTLAPDAFAPALETVLADVGADAATPVIVCGMAGSAQGWTEASYLDAPCALDAIANHAVATPAGGRDVRILPGLAQRDLAAPDVMRGEETQLLGGWRAHGFEGAACLPGTHSKWVEVEAGKLLRFRTAMTGELFALLAERSTLSAYAGGGAATDFDGQDFKDAVLQGLNTPDALTRDLFTVRAAPLLRGASALDARARLSGLLIGAELAVAPLTSGAVVLISSGGVADAYARAFAIAGIAYESLDGSQMAQAGLLAAAQTIWPERFEGNSP